MTSYATTLPPLPSSVPPSMLPPHQQNMQLSSLPSDTNSDIRPTSSPFNILQYPALKKIMDVHAAQRKSASHISAFSSIKPKQGRFSFSNSAEYIIIYYSTKYFKLHITKSINILHILGDQQTPVSNSGITQQTQSFPSTPGIMFPPTPPAPPFPA